MSYFRRVLVLLSHRCLSAWRGVSGQGAGKGLAGLALTAVLGLALSCGGGGGGGTTTPTPTPTVPTITAFTASPATITPYQVTTLSWTVTGATSLTVTGGAGTLTVSGTTTSVSPAATTTYTLTATNSAGSATAQTTVTVNPPSQIPIITSFIATPAAIQLGQATTFSWSVTGATTLSIDQGIGTVTGTSVTVTPQSFAFLPTNTFPVFMLTATNSYGSATAQTPLMVSPATPVITAPASINAGATGYASVPFPGMMGVIGQPGGFAWTISGGTFTSGGSLLGNAVVFIAGASGTVQLSCVVTDMFGRSSSAGTAACTILAAPTISAFSATPGTINAGQSSTLSWSATGATNLSIDQGVGTVTGSSVTVSPTSTTTYTLTASNANGSVTSSATVVVNATKPSISSFTASPSTINAGQSSTLSWSATGATSISIDQGVGTVTGTSVTVTPASTTTYTLTATNATGSVTSTTAVTVNIVPPTISTFTSTPNSITSGQSTTLSWSVAGATSLSVDQGVGTVTGTNVTVTPASTTNYTLTATNTAGSVTASTKVFVQTMLAFTLPGGVSLNVVSIPNGTFTMGAPANEEDAFANEMPTQQVTISQSFYMANLLTTQAQWQAVMGSNPSMFSVAGGGSMTDDLTRPVEQVSWIDITASTIGFMDKLNAATASTRPTGLVFRLPTEAEWEYSCRAGTATRFYWGDDLAYTDIATNAWYFPNSSHTTHPVGKMTKNAFGLFDMAGNVWEWCEDWYGLYPGISETDPKGPASGTCRIVRGGSWNSLQGYFCRSAYRYYIGPPSSSYSYLGFRVVLAAP